jgi:hypothetical protein
MAVASFCAVTLFTTLLVILLNQSPALADHRVEWQRFEDWTLRKVGKFVSLIEEDLLKVVDKAAVGKNCRESVLRYKNGLKKLELEPLKSKRK